MTRVRYEAHASHLAGVAGLWAAALLAAWFAPAACRGETPHRFDELVFRDRVLPHWDGDGHAFWYRVATGPATHEFVRVDAIAGERRPAFDHELLARAFSETLEEAVAPSRLPVDDLVFLDSGLIEMSAFSRRWRVDRSTYQLELLDETTPSELRDRGVRWLPPESRTRRNGAEAHVEVLNCLDEPIELFWIDAQAARRSYGTVSPGDSARQHTFQGHVWLVVDSQGRHLAWFTASSSEARVVLDGPKRAHEDAHPKSRSKRANSAISPDGAMEAFLRDSNVWLRRLDSGEETPLSTTGTPENAFEGRFFWSPDSRFLATLQTRQGMRRRITLVESAPCDQLQPKLHDLQYVKPGDPIDQPRLRLFRVAEKEELEAPPTRYPNPWSISRFHWRPDSSELLFLYNARGHQKMEVLAMEAASGKIRPIVEESSATFLHYSGKLLLHHVEHSGEIIWMSERSGFNHLYLYDGRQGRLKNPITTGDWPVRDIVRIDDESRQIWFRASGIYPDQDPYYIHLCRVNFDGSGMVVLTEADGTHRWEFSPDGRFLIARWSRVDHPPVTELRRCDDGRLVCRLEKGDWKRLLDAGWKPPERFVAKGRDGKTDIYGILVRPNRFDPEQRYPVVENIYAGPHDAFTPKAFGPLRQMADLADLGFIVVKLDGMGTDHRGKAFHDVCWKNLGDSGFPDRIAWIRAAAKAHPEIDIERVGIYGGSAGGQSALRALLAHGDFYDAAVADCGCHDNRMDKIWWNEQWMGWPIGPHYKQQSNVTQAHRLQGDLLLTVGELDRNVDPASTMQVVDALIRADKDFDLLLVPGAGHGVGETPYARRRRQRFFVEHLQGNSPESPKGTPPPQAEVPAAGP